MTMMKWRLWAIVLGCSALLMNAARGGERTLAVPPRDTDPAIGRFLASNLVMTREGADRGLLVFLPGTTPRETPEDGKPFQGMQLFLQSAVAVGYRVIALQYDNTPAVMQVCHENSDDACADKVREKRIFGEDTSNLIDDPPAESIASRLAHLLTYLAEKQPRQHWDRYLADGAPRWDAITFAGHSQGAGMAAFIAKKHAIARVVLLSGPIDFLSDGKTIAPWVATDSATPPDRWFALRHAREKGSELLAQSYDMLHIPESHIRVLNGDATPLPGRDLPNPFHVSVVADKVTPRDASGRPRYAGDWKFLLAGGS